MRVAAKDDVDSEKDDWYQKATAQDQQKFRLDTRDAVNE